jgi:hypothetical protein
MVRPRKHFRPALPDAKAGRKYLMRNFCWIQFYAFDPAPDWRLTLARELRTIDAVLVKDAR